MDEKDPKPSLVMNSSPSLKISNVYSESNVKNEKSEHSPMQFIRVRTPGQLNGSALAESRPQILKPGLPTQVIVKRLGNTTIRQTVSLKVGEALNAEMKKILTHQKIKQAANTKPLTRRLTQAHSHIDLSHAAPIVRKNPPDPRDVTIRELKRVLLECRQELTQAQMMMNRLTIVINDVLLKVEKAATDKPPSIVQPPKKPVATKSTGGKKSHEVTYRLPIFPISTLGTLTQFESDLKNRTFFKVVMQKMETVCNSVKIKQEMILPFVFKSILNMNVLSNFVWDAQSTFHPSHKMYFKNFHMFQSFFARLSNSVSSSLYFHQIDPKKFELFLRSKIVAQDKLQKNQDKRFKLIIENELKSKKELDSFINLANKPKQRTSGLVQFVPTMLLECNERLTTETTTDKRDEKRIEWLEDEAASINQSEMEIINPDDEDLDEEHEMESFDGDHPSEHSNDHEANLESVLDEHDFEFLDC